VSDLRSLRAARTSCATHAIDRQPPCAGCQNAAGLMEERRISSVLVLDARGVLCGALDSATT
jgi:hypothetical protein